MPNNSCFQILLSFAYEENSLMKRIKHSFMCTKMYSLLMKKFLFYFFDLPNFVPPTPSFKSITENLQLLILQGHLKCWVSGVVFLGTLNLWLELYPLLSWAPFAPSSIGPSLLDLLVITRPAVCPWILQFKVGKWWLQAPEMKNGSLEQMLEHKATRLL